MTQDTEAERPPRMFAVYSPTGVHIGLWGDGKIAADVAAESPGNTIEELVAADEYEALHERAEAAERKVLELRAECAMLRLDMALNRDLDQITDEESQDVEGSLRAERDALRTRVDAAQKDAEAWARKCASADDRCEALAAERDVLREALAWYREQARLARLIHSEGDAGRHALADDGGDRARAALTGEAKP